MGFISAATLESLRRLDESTFEDRADIISKGRVSDGAGGSIVTPTTQANVPCRRVERQAGESEGQFGGQLVSGLQWIFAFPLGTVISKDDEIVDDDERFAVLSVLGPRTYETARRVIALKK